MLNFGTLQGQRLDSSAKSTSSIWGSLYSSVRNFYSTLTKQDHGTWSARISVLVDMYRFWSPQTMFPSLSLLFGDAGSSKKVYCRRNIGGVTLSAATFLLNISISYIFVRSFRNYASYSIVMYFERPFQRLAYHIINTLIILSSVVNRTKPTF